MLHFNAVILTAALSTRLLFPGQHQAVPELFQESDTPRAVVEGFRLLREYDRTAKREFAVQAYRFFERAIANDSSGYAHSGLAVTLHSAPFIVPASYLGGSSINASARLATEALRRNPEIPGLPQLLGELSTPELPQSQIEEMIAALKSCCAAATTTARLDALGALAAVTFKRGRVADTEAAARQLLLMGGDSGSAYRWLTLSAAERGDRAAAAEHYAAVLHSASHRSRPDLAADVALLDSVAGDSASLMKVWSKSGFASGLAWSDRAAEHYVRLARALREFRLTTSDKRGARASDVTVARRDIPVDDRGIILIRHGTPDTVIRAVGANYRPAETWVYRNTSVGRQLFLFAGLRGEGGMQLVDDPMAVVNWESMSSKMPSSFSQLSLEHALQVLSLPLILDMEDWFQRLALEDARYGTLARALSALAASRSGRDMSVLQDRLYEVQMRNLVMTALVHQDLDRALESESGRPRYERWLPLAVEVYRFRDADMNPELVPVMLVTTPDSALQMRASFGATSAGAQTSRDTSLTIPGRNTSRVLLSPAVVQPGAATWFINVQAQNGMGASTSGTLPVTRFNGLDISDIVIADPRPSGSMRRGNQRLGPLPGMHLRSGAPFGLYYEVYGARAGDYEVTITIEPAQTHVLKKLTGIFGRKRMSMKVAFSSQADGSAVQQTFYNLTADLAPGPYRLHLTVKQGELLTSNDRPLTIIPAPN